MSLLVNGNGNGGPNGKLLRWIAGIGGTIAASLCVTMIVWVVASVNAMQIQTNGHEVRLGGLQNNFEIQRTQEAASMGRIEALIQAQQTETRTAITDTQTQTRAAIGELSSILTNLRIRLGDPQAPKR
jgi:hypothetical protein